MMKLMEYIILSSCILYAASLSKYVLVQKRVQPSLFISNLISAKNSNFGIISKQCRFYQPYSPRPTYFQNHITELRISSQSISSANNNLLHLLYSFVLKWNSYSVRLLSILISLVEPTIAGGLLSGGLHAITGSFLHEKSLS